MPFPMKIQPVDSDSMIVLDQAKPAPKSRLKRLFERQFPSVLRVSSSEKLAGDIEPSSLALDKMVRSFMEDGNEKQRNGRCNCFQGNLDDSSGDDLDLPSSGGDLTSADAADVLKGLLLCASVTERNLAADASAILEKAKITKGKEESRRILTDGLRLLGYDAAICRSCWEKSHTHPAGEHEYVDVIAGGYRILIELDFRSEFEIARSTKSYRALLQSLPTVFVGTEDRLSQIVAAVSDAARQSLKKKGLHFPPWRKHEYMRAKWLSPYERVPRVDEAEPVEDREAEAAAEAEEEVTWTLPPVTPKASQNGAKVVTGLASVLRERA